MKPVILPFNRIFVFVCFEAFGEVCFYNINKLILFFYFLEEKRREYIYIYRNCYRIEGKEKRGQRVIPSPKNSLREDIPHIRDKTQNKGLE